MTSRERMLAALDGRPVDHVPCSFMIFTNLRRRSRDDEEHVLKQLEMGLDATCHAGFLEPSLHPDAKETVWQSADSEGELFHRRIDTPRGPLEQTVRVRDGWPRGDDFCLWNDLVVPRSREQLVKPREELDKLPYLLGPFRDESVEKLRRSSLAARSLAERRGLLLVGGWGSVNATLARDDGVMGADAMAWLSGFETVCELELLEPGLVREYVRALHEWNTRRIGIYLDVARPDLILRRAWYETTDFWTPAAYREIILPCLRREVELVHQAGSRIGLITTSAFMPILDDIISSGIDVLVGLDPLEGKGADLALVKERFRRAGRALWGGVSGALTVELGTEAETRGAVREALRILSPGGGFILSPVDNVRDDTERAWANTRAFITEWEAGR